MRAAVVFLAALLSGCASLEGQLENRLACTVARDSMFVVSMYGRWIGIATVIADRDRPAGCR